MCGAAALVNMRAAGDSGEPVEGLGTDSTGRLELEEQFKFKFFLLYHITG